MPLILSLLLFEIFQAGDGLPFSVSKRVHGDFLLLGKDMSPGDTVLIALLNFFWPWKKHLARRFEKGDNQTK